MTTRKNKDLFYEHIPPISLELTNRCNLKCPWCGNRNLTRKRGIIRWKLFEKLVSECRGGKHNIKFLNGAGEPLLYPKLEKAISFIKKNNAGDASFATNGVLLTRNKIRNLLDAGLSSIYISLGSLDPDIYSKTKGGNLSRVLENIRYLLEEVPKTFSIAVELMKSKLQPSVEESVDRFRQLFGEPENVYLNPVENVIFPVSGTDYRVCPYQLLSCSVPLEFMTIVHDGRVALCCLDQDVECLLGDINTQTVEEVWYSPHTQEILKNLSTGSGARPTLCTERCHLSPAASKFCR